MRISLVQSSCDSVVREYTRVRRLNMCGEHQEIEPDFGGENPESRRDRRATAYIVFKASLATTKSSRVEPLLRR